MNGASFFVVGTSKTLGIAAVCQACAEILAVILAQNRENRGCLLGLSRDFSRDSNVCGGMNGAAACFAVLQAELQAPPELLPCIFEEISYRFLQM